MKAEGPELSALIDLARYGDEPSDEDRRRVTSRVAARLAMGAGVGAAALTLSRAGWAGSLKTWGIVAVALAGAGAGTYFVASGPGDAANPAVSPAPVVSRSLRDPDVVPEAAPVLVERAPAELPSAERAPAPRHRVSSAAPVAPATAAPGPVEPGRLAQETAALKSANDALRSGDAARALTLLDAFARDFPGGLLTQEALATRVSALCSLGRVNDARALAARFTKRYPRSPVAARVRASCGGSR